MNELKLYQIGLPIEKLSFVTFHWANRNEPRKKLFLYPSQKQPDYVVVETRSMELAAMIIRDIPEARVNVLEEYPRQTQI
jgi:hypothetical protein